MDFFLSMIRVSYSIRIAAARIKDLDLRTISMSDSAIARKTVFPFPGQSADSMNSSMKIYRTVLVTIPGVPKTNA